jgi:anti-sigma factor RsiW
MIPPEHLHRFDAYLDGTLPEEELSALEAVLREDAELRAAFVRYAQLPSDLAIEMRARAAGDRLLQQIQPPRRLSWVASLLTLAAGILLALGVTLLWPRAVAPEEIAWLVNAQNAEWAEDGEPGPLRPGTHLHLERGLVALRFASGARVVLEGPAEAELLSPLRMALTQGKIGASIPESAHGFTVLSPRGEVIDLGTEFGVAVNADGATNVHVFEGEVIAKDPTGQHNLFRDQSAQIDAQGLRVDRLGQEGVPFVRAIVPPPLIAPRTLRLDFRKTQDGTLRDENGQGIGLTQRLPGTGGRFAEQSPNLRLIPGSGRLELTTTNSDINRQVNLDQGEYLGICLSELGFTGDEDFEVGVRIPNIPALKRVGQFGVYAGTRSDANIRGGLISRKDHGEYTIFHVNNQDGVDRDSHFLGLFTTGDEIRIRLKRTAGKYGLTVENLTTGAASTLVIPHPTWLDGQKDLYVGLFGANTQSELRRTLRIEEFRATVWTRHTRPGKM